MTRRRSTDIGNEGEEMAAIFLQNRGFEVVDKNWKTKCCEIDLVVQNCPSRWAKKCKIHFVEVKYRKSDSFGGPEEFVTSEKLKQLKRAAKHWVHEREWSGQFQIDVIAINGFSGTIAYYPNVTNHY